MIQSFSSTPSSRTPSPKPSRTRPMGSKVSQQTFARLLNNDRGTVRTTLERFMKLPNWRDMDTDARKATMSKMISEKLKERQTGLRDVKSAIRTYPEQVDVKKEIAYFRDLFATEIEEATTKDDQEPNSALRGVRGIKEESTDDDDFPDVVDEPSTDDEVNSDSDEKYDEEDGQDESSTYTVVRRGFVVQTSVEANDSAIKAKPKDFSAAKTSSVNSKVARGGITKKQVWKTAKRSWKWIDGRLVRCLG